METGDKNIRRIEGTHRKLGYVQEFRHMLREHPGIINTALLLTQKAEDEYAPPNIKIGLGELEWNKEKTEFEVVKRDGENIKPMPYSQFIWGRGTVLIPGDTVKDEKTGLEVTVLAKTNRKFYGGFIGTGSLNRIDMSTYLKMKLGDKTFFVKKSSATNNPGYEEFKNSKKAKGALADLDDVTVVDAQLGYEDNQQSWFVSKWEDLESTGFFPVDSWEGGVPNDYGEFLPKAKDIEEELAEERKIKQKAKSVTEQIKIRLAEAGIDIQDIDPNLFYNPQTDKFFLLDITPREETKGVGQPRRFGIREHPES